MMRKLTLLLVLILALAVAGGSNALGAGSVHGTNLDFGRAAVGDTQTMTETLKNVSGGDLAIDAVHTTGSAFDAASPGPKNTCTGVTLGVDEQCDVDVHYTPERHERLPPTTTSTIPTAPAAYQRDRAAWSTSCSSRTPPAPGRGTVTVQGQDVSLSGTGTLPGASVSPGSIGFGNQPVSTSSAIRTITVTSNGNENLVFSQATLTGANPAIHAQRHLLRSVTAAARRPMHDECAVLPHVGRRR